MLTDHPIRVAVRDIDAALKSVRDVNPTFMATRDKAAALVELAGIEARVGELRLRLLAEAGDVAHDAGARDAAAWFSHQTRGHRTDAAADLRLAEALSRRPHLAERLRGGHLNLAQARVIAAALDDLPDEVPTPVVTDAESTLVGNAADFEPDALRRLGRRILEVVAPEIAEAIEARALARLETIARERMRLGIRPLGDGTTRITGLLPDADAARLAVYLHAFTNPRRDQALEAAAEGRRVPYGRRTAQAFCHLLETLTPTDLPIHGGDATTVVITMTLDALRADLGTATLAHTPPGGASQQISAHEARRLACTAHLIPAVLGSEGEVLDLGRSQRLFSRAQRRALLLRDRTCRAEGCDIPGTWAEAHHLLPWSRGGPTDLDNALLLCSHHHHRIHEPEFVSERMLNGDLRFHRRC